MKSDPQFVCNLSQIRGEDRLFTTSMAINALLSTWTVFDDETKKLIWEKGDDFNSLF